MELENKNKSRRNFVKKAALAGGSVVFASLLPGFENLVFAFHHPDKKGKWYGIVINIEKCIGCGLCAKTCKIENDVPKDPFYFRSWVEQYVITNDQEVIVKAPNGGIDGFKQQVDDKDIFKSFFVPKMCNHCSNSPCIQVCPVGATFLTEEGIVLIDEKYCIGCGYCVQACPYGTRFINPEKGTAEKCTLCYHRIKKGLTPACFEVCPTGARLYGDLNDPKSEIVKFLKEHTCRILRPNLNTGEKLFYNQLNEEVS
jgi:tetrathionate reductase subunit B